MNKKERYKKIREIFDVVYHDAICSLVHKTPHELLISTILAAQSTDKRVNFVTQTLYKKYPSPEAFADAEYEELCDDIKSIGLYRSKAKNIIGCCRRLIADFGGDVPNSLEMLLTLPGVGRKTASVVLGDAFNDPHFVIDTHAARLSKRMGFTRQTDPYKIELDLAKIIPIKESAGFCHQMVFHGRAICAARLPKCNECPILSLCPQKFI